MIRNSLTLLIVLTLLLLFSCKKKEALSQEELIEGNYATIKSNSWSGGPNSGSHIIDSNRVVSVTVKGPGVLTFQDGSTTFDLPLCNYCSNYHTNSVIYGAPADNTLRYDTLTGELNVTEIIFISAGGGSSDHWSGYKIP